MIDLDTLSPEEREALRVKYQRVVNDATRGIEMETALMMQAYRELMQPKRKGWRRIWRARKAGQHTQKVANGNRYYWNTKIGRMIRQRRQQRRAE